MADEPAQGELKGPDTEPPKPRPIPGVRRARVCTECHRRAFLTGPDDTWDCPEHGKRKTVDQPNAPYFGQSTE